MLLVDPGVHGYKLAALADELIEHDNAVTAGFSTHPHWDHLLWHARLGSATATAPLGVRPPPRPDWKSDAT